jgi:SagB-type dehydrogenase family enzyme
MAQSEEVHVIPLPRPDLGPAASLQRALEERRSTREFASGALPLAKVSSLLWAAQGPTGSGRRTNPSAGATYPLEVYLVTGAVEGLAPGLYRYRSREHALERVSARDLRADLVPAAAGQEFLGEAPCAIAIAAVLERTSGRYGARARRYVDMEVGEVTQSVHLAAAALDLGTVIVGKFEDAAVKQVLGLPAEEEPLALMPVGRPK